MAKYKILLISLFLAVANISASAHDYQKGEVLIDHPTLSMPIGPSKVTAGYLAIKNKAKQADQLIGVSSKIANKIELHNMVVENDVMRMFEMEDGIELPSGEWVELEAGGLHVMFMGLKQPLTHGEFITVELEFKNAGKLSVDFQVDEKLSAGSKHSEHKKH